MNMSAMLTLDLPTLSPVPLTVAPCSGDLAGWLRAAAEVLTGLRASVDEAAVVVHAGDVVAIEQLARRLDGVRLAALGRVDAARRANADADPAGTTDHGAASTGAWYAGVSRRDGAAAASDTVLARQLSQGEDLCSTRQALADGVISTEHAKVIAKTMRDLPDGLTSAERARIGGHLVEQARQVDPARLRRVARRALAALPRPEEDVEAHHGDQLQDEEEQARAKTRLTLHDNGDGTTTGHFTVPTLAASILRRIIESMTAPRRQQDARSASGAPAPESEPPATANWVGDPARGAEPDQSDQADQADQGPTCRPAAAYTMSDGTLDTRAMTADWAHARGLALTALLEHLPTDHLSSKVAATVIVTLRQDQLITALGAAGVDTGIELSAAQARRLACDAGLVPAVLGGTSLPVDLGQSRRLFTDTHRVALASLYETCAAHGCDRPYAWCELHHLSPWRNGGTTALANAVPVCPYHHHQLDNPRYHHQVYTDDQGRHTITLRRRT